MRPIYPTIPSKRTDPFERSGHLPARNRDVALHAQSGAGHPGARLRRLRHRHRRIRHHGAVARGGDDISRQRAGCRLCHHRLCGGRGHRRAAHRRCRGESLPPYAPADPDDGLRHRQSGKRRRPEPVQHDRVAVSDRPAAWRLFRRRGPGGRLAGADRTPHPDRRLRDARAHRGDAPGHSDHGRLRHDPQLARDVLRRRPHRHADRDVALAAPAGRPASRGGGRHAELIAFTHPQVLLTLLMAATGFGGMFSIFSYIAATATDYAHMPVAMVAAIMGLFGLGMNAGNLLGSRMADKSLMGTIGGMLVFNVVIMTVFGLSAQWPLALCITTFLLGCTFASGPAVQSRLMDVARDGQTLAAASMHSAFNIANAIGAWLGGRVLDYGFGYPATGYVGAVLSAVGLGVFIVSWSLDRRGYSGGMFAEA